MLPQNDFDNFTISGDEFLDDVPKIELYDLDEKYEGKIKASIMMSTFNRGSQLARTLETLCRQNFKAFEVLINDDGSTQDIKSVIARFSPYLNIKYFFSPRKAWKSCPSSAFKMMFPHTEGEIVIISHPEIMIDYNGIGFIYDEVIGNKTTIDSYRYTISEYRNGVPIQSPIVNEKYRWAMLKAGFIDKERSGLLDSIDWHSCLKRIQKIGEFWMWTGLGGRKNEVMVNEIIFPWWFIGGTKRDCPIWTEMPEFVGHGIIDVWLCDWRMKNRITDVLSLDIMCYHQPHAIMAIAPEGESTDPSRFAREVL